MILSNVEILAAIKAGAIRIGALTGEERPGEPPFNTAAVDLHLGDGITVLKTAPAAFDMRKPGISKFLADNSERNQITQSQPYCLGPHQLILGNTRERVGFPIASGRPAYSARVEGRSSLARCGILIHFTAPTIHAGFHGTITLEIINLGPLSFLLFPDMAICQLIVEQVAGEVVPTENQFMGQSTPAGL